MKKICYVFLLFCLSLKAQVTTSLTVEGAITKPLTFTFEELRSYPVHTLDSLVIFNHKMERKSTLKSIKGVLLKELLEKAEFSVNSPKILSEFYIVCVADDGYKVVFSWNEIFNSATGDKTLVVTAINGNTTISQKEGLLLLTPTDKANGRRYVKNLSKILIQKVL